MLISGRGMIVAVCLLSRLHMTRLTAGYTTWTHADLFPNIASFRQRRKALLSSIH